MKSQSWTNDTHVFSTHVEEGNIILTVRSRISDRAETKYLLTEEDAHGIRDTLWLAIYENAEALPSVKGVEEVDNGQ